MELKEDSRSVECRIIWGLRNGLEIRLGNEARLLTISEGLERVRMLYSWRSREAFERKPAIAELFDKCDDIALPRALTIVEIQPTGEIFDLEELLRDEFTDHGLTLSDPRVHGLDATESAGSFLYRAVEWSVAGITGAMAWETIRSALLGVHNKLMSHRAKPAAPLAMSLDDAIRNAKIALYIYYGLSPETTDRLELVGDQQGPEYRRKVHLRLDRLDFEVELDGADGQPRVIAVARRLDGVAEQRRRPST